MAYGVYSKHLDSLTALVSYLALTPRRSRTPGNLAADLSLSPEEVETTFETFPGLFRRSRNLSSEGEAFYTLHARFAMRPTQGDETEESPALRAEILKVLLEFIAQRAQDEQAQFHLDKELKGARNNARIAAAAAAAAAVLAFVAALLSR